MQRPVDVDVTVLHFRSWRPPMQLSCVGVCARCVWVFLGVLVWVFPGVSVCVCEWRPLLCNDACTREGRRSPWRCFHFFYSLCIFCIPFYFSCWRRICINFVLPTFWRWAKGFFGDAVWATWLYKHTTPAAVVKVKDNVRCARPSVCLKLVF